MIGVLGHDSALYGYIRPETTWSNEMNVVMNHAPGAGSIAKSKNKTLYYINVLFIHVTAPNQYMFSKIRVSFCFIYIFLML